MKLKGNQKQLQKYYSKMNEAALNIQLYELQVRIQEETGLSRSYLQDCLYWVKNELKGKVV